MRTLIFLAILAGIIGVLFILEGGTCMEDLLIEYLETLKETQKIIDRLDKEIDVYKVMFEDEKEDESLRAWAEEMAGHFLYDKSIVSSWKRNIEYAIKWIQTGHQPGYTRGIERRSVYQNTKSIDPLLMQRYFRCTQPMFPWDQGAKESVITRSEKEIINQAISVLSERELEVFLMAKGNGFSQYKIAEMLKLSRNSVKTMIKRADKKIAIILSQHKEGER